MDSLTEVLSRARYNELVHVCVDGENEICLAASLDRENGGIHWNPIPKEEELSRHISTKSWILPMLNDMRRNEVFRSSIESACAVVMSRMEEQVNTGNGEAPATITVLDIGSGTGLLGMMVVKAFQNLNKKAVAAGQRTVVVHIHSIEMASAMVQIARKTISDNHMDNSFTVIEGHSGNIAPLQPKACLCVSELLDSRLLGEGIIPSIRDAWDRHLEPEALVIPQAGRMYAQLIQADWLEDFNGPKTMNIKGGSDNIRLTLDLMGEQMLVGAAGNFVTVNAQKLFDDDEMTALTDPILVREVDLSAQSLLSSQLNTRQLKLTMRRHGKIHGVLVWWELDLYNSTKYSTKPGTHWQDHWHQCIYLVEIKERFQTKIGDGVVLEVSDLEDNVHFRLKKDACTKEQTTSKRRKTEPNPPANHISLHRACQLNNIRRLNVMEEGIASSLATKGFHASVLDLSDFSLCAMLAAKLGAQRVFSLESSSGTLPEISARIVQVSNCLPDEGSQFDVLKCHAESLSRSFLGDVPVEVLVSEVYYHVLEGHHLIEALNFYFMARSLQTRGLLSSSVVSCPSKCRVMACAIQSDQLKSAYKDCGDDETPNSVCGIDHKYLNSLRERDHIVVNLPHWQYEYEKLSTSIEVSSLSFTDFDRDLSAVEVGISCFERGGSCDAMMIWLEYYFPRNADPDAFYATLGRGDCQIFCIFRQPKQIDSNDFERAKIVTKVCLQEKSFSFDIALE